MPQIAAISNEQLQKLLPTGLFKEWQAIVALINANYDMTQVWHSAGKDWMFELKFQRGGKTLLSLLPKADHSGIGLMIIFGKAERDKLQAIQAELPESLIQTYNAAKTYHDGKWVMFMLPDPHIHDHLLKLLSVKRKPNKKP